MTHGPRYTGFDVSLNHGAAITIDVSHGGWRVDVDFFTDKKTVAKKYGGAFHAKLKEKDDDLQAVTRLATIHSWIEGVLRSRAPHYAGIEGYAYAMANQAHQLGEVGGMVRMCFFGRGAPYRVHDPSSVKMFVTGKGNATKEEMLEVSQRRWAFPATNDWDETTRGDIVDAYAIARLVKMEHELRIGALKHSELSEDELRVFNRVTKANPINVLARRWTTNACTRLESGLMPAILRAAKALADSHRREDLAMTRVLVDHNATTQLAEIRLVEVSGSVDNVGEVLPFRFPARPDAGVPYSTSVVLLSEDDWQCVKDGSLRLPEGWSAPADFVEL